MGWGLFVEGKEIYFSCCVPIMWQVEAVEEVMEATERPEKKAAE